MNTRRTVRRVRQVVAELEQLGRLGDALELAAFNRAKDARDRAAGVIPMVEVAPGVFAMPKPKPQRTAPRTLGKVSARVLELEGDARDLIGAFEQLRGQLWPRR